MGQWGTFLRTVAACFLAAECLLVSDSVAFWEAAPRERNLRFLSLESFSSLASNTREWLARAEEALNSALHDLLANASFNPERAIPLSANRREGHKSVPDWCFGKRTIWNK